MKKQSNKTHTMIAITGSICTGKSFVLDIFAKCGFPIFDCDIIVKDILQNDVDVIEKIRKTFPDAVLDSGKIDKTKLSRIVFNNKIARVSLENIIYPKLFIRQDEFIKINIERHKILVFEVPLLYEKNIESLYDFVIVTTSPKYIKVRRAEHKGISRQMLEYILKNQLSDKTKQLKADYVIDTNKRIEDVKKEVIKLIKKLEKNKCGK